MDRIRQNLSLVVIILLGATVPIFGQTTPIFNTTSGVYHNSLIEAMNNVSAGDVITLAAVTFDERILIEAPLSLLGDPGGGTVIDIRGKVGWGIWLGSSGITLENITVLSDNLHQGYGLHCDPGTTDLTLKNVRVLNNATSGIDLNGLVGPGENLIENCEVINSGAGFGLAMSSCQNVVVRNFSSSKNGYGDIGILESAYTSNRSLDLTFEGSMDLSGPQGDGLGGIIIQSDSTVIDPGIGLSFDIDMQAGLIHQLTGTTTYDGNPLGFLLCKSDVVASLSSNLTEGLGVSDLLGRNLLTGEVEIWPGMSLQEAVNAANDEDIIRVAQPGVYDTVSVSINKSITILGPNVGVLPDDPLRDTEAVFAGGLNISASNVTIDGIRILGKNDAPTGLQVTAGADNVSISNSVIRGWFEESGNLTPVGLVVEGNVDLTGCSLRNWPIAARLNSGSASLTDCIITDNRGGFEMNSSNGGSDEARFSNCTLRNAGADAFRIQAADAADSLVITGGTANLHGYALRFDQECSYRIEGGVYSESEIQILGLNTEKRIALCEGNDFNNPAIVIDACTDNTAVNFEPCATIDSGNCQFGGCTDIGACNYDENAAQNDGSCDFQTCAGCTNPIACNYDDTATIEDGSCEYISCRGCTDPTALNYASSATYDDGSCLFPGCTNPEADNYDADANFDNGVCFFYGCTDAGACNFDPTANLNLGTCDFTSCAGCLNPRACNYDATATIDTQNCDFTSCRGCTNPDALNYDPSATVDDGSCRIAGCTDAGATNYDADANINDGSCIFSGCLDATACNYDPNASVNDGSCEFTSCAGCAIEGFCNYDPDVTIHDGSLCDYLSCCGDPAATNYDAAILPQLTFGCTYGGAAGMAFLETCTLPIACNYLADASCEFDSCAGCTDPAACNYDASASLSTNTCVYPMDIYGDANVDCDGNCLNDTDGDGICDEDEVNGCTDEAACNYDEAATQDDGSCESTSCGGCTDSGACNYDANALLNDGSCDYNICAGCTDPAACDYDATATISGECTFPVDIHGSDAVDCDGNCLSDTDGDGVCDGDEILGCDNASACNYNASATENDGSCDLLSCKGCMDETACNFDASATSPDESCDYVSCAGCLDPLACNYDATATNNDLCTYPVEDYLDCAGNCLVDTDGDGVCDPNEVVGCKDAEACNFSETATEDDGSCDYLDCAGCTNPGACNFDDTATINDGSCNYTSCQGCTDPEACNYIAGATTDDGSCIYVLDLFNVNYLTCDEECENDADGDGICDELEISGCTDSTACNYSAAAEIDDSSCEFTSCGGCLDEDACNYNEGAEFSDGSCSYPSTLYGKDYVDCFNVCLNDANGDGICDEEESGCTDPTACNYDPIPATDDGSCFFPAEDYLDCDGNCLNDTDGDGVCDEIEVSGCIDPTACGYNAAATDDDGSCQYVVDDCDSCVDNVFFDGDADNDGFCDDYVCPGDFNGDGIRSASDVLVVLAAYGCDTDCGSADLDGNGFVTASDVLAMLSYFGTLCPNN
jgi:hypothetical protein